MLQARTDEHSWASPMLPWLVNNSLPANDLRRLQAHLECCAACRDDLQWERALARRIHTAPVVSHVPHAALSRLLQRIDAAEAARGPAWWRSLHPALLWRPGKRRYLLATAIAAQAAAIAALAVALAWVATRPEPGYRTATSDATAVESVQLQVVFEASVTVAEMQAALAKIKGRIVSGPSSAGVYLVATDRPAADKAELESAAVALAAQPGVAFVAVLPRE